MAQLLQKPFHNPRQCITLRDFQRISWSEIVGGKVKEEAKCFPVNSLSWQKLANKSLQRPRERVTFFADGAAIKEGEIQYVAFLTFQILNLDLKMFSRNFHVPVIVVPPNGISICLICVVLYVLPLYFCILCFCFHLRVGEVRDL